MKHNHETLQHAKSKGDMSKIVPYNLAYLEAKCAELENKCAELESKCAELLEALEAVEIAATMGFASAEILRHDSAIRKGIRAAIAKAKGEQP